MRIAFHIIQLLKSCEIGIYQTYFQMKYELFPINKVEVSVGAGDAIVPTDFEKRRL